MRNQEFNFFLSHIKGGGSAISHFVHSNEFCSRSISMHIKPNLKNPLMVVPYFTLYLCFSELSQPNLREREREIIISVIYCIQRFTVMTMLDNYQR